MAYLLQCPKPGLYENLFCPQIRAINWSSMLSNLYLVGPTKSSFWRCQLQSGTAGFIERLVLLQSGLPHAQDSLGILPRMSSINMIFRCTLSCQKKSVVSIRVSILVSIRVYPVGQVNWRSDMIFDLPRGGKYRELWLLFGARGDRSQAIGRVATRSDRSVEV